MAKKVSYGMKKGQFYSGEFVPKNKMKCINSKNPIYRSSWEQRFMNFCDMNENITSWGSETHVIEYFLKLDGKTHRYFTDFYLEMIDKKTKRNKKVLIEVKPYAQTYWPKQPKRKTTKSMKNYEEACKTALKNKAKWEAADKWAKERGMIFQVITENEIYGPK